MKKIYLTLIASVAISAFSISCAASRSQGTSHSTQKIEVTEEDENECEREARYVPRGEFRAYSVGVSPRRNVAKEKAVLSAKGEIIKDMKGYVKSAGTLYEKEIGSGYDINSVQEYENAVSSYAEGVLENCKVICSKVYKIKKGDKELFECHVCVSVPYYEVVEKSAEAAMIKVNEKKGKSIKTKPAKDSREKAYEKYLEDKTNL